MQFDNNDYVYPPYNYLKEVLTNCPKAGLLYLQLWEYADDSWELIVPKKNIRDKFLMSPTRLRNDLMNLVREGFVSVHETKKDYKFELVGWNDEEDYQ